VLGEEQAGERRGPVEIARGRCPHAGG
jgi:hypothetical protein